jgi:3'-5' exoribonuclease
MTTKVYVEELSEGEFVQTTFLVTTKEIRESRTGDPYLRLVLEDRTGRVEGRVWNDPDVYAGRFDVDDFVALRGEVVRFGDQNHVEIGDLDRVPESSVDPADYFPTSRWSADAMFRQLRDVLDETLESQPIRAFLDALFDDESLTERFRTAPAAMSNHHAYRGGLLEHCLSMVRVAISLADHYALYYPGLINRDLLVAGVILHDFAKVWELSYRRSFDYTSPGRLIGHIPMGAELVGKIAARARRPISEDLQLHLQHLVLSHHGEMEYGSPVTPKTPEALLLHQVDMIDSRMNMCWNLHERVYDPDANESWSEFRRTLGARMLFRGRNSGDWDVPPRIGVADLAGPGLANGRSRPDDADASSDALTLDLFDEDETS